MPVFPSLEWFEEVRSVFNADEAYQGGGGGLCDAIMGVKVGAQTYMLVFEGMECADAREITDAELVDADFYLDMSADDWQAMLRNIKDNDGAALDWTLNTLDLEKEDGLALTRNDDQYRQDFFFRYNQTFQYFFDASARIDTEFAAD